MLTGAPFPVFMSFSMSMTAAGASFSMSMAVSSAGRIGNRRERSGEKRLDRLIGISFDARRKTNSRLGQRHLRSRADSSANQEFDVPLAQKSGKSAVTAAVRRFDLLVLDGVVLDVVKRDFRRMSEMLKDVSCFCDDCDSHDSFSQ